MKHTMLGLIMLVSLGLLVLTSSTTGYADGPLGSAGAISTTAIFGQAPAGSPDSMLVPPVKWYGVPNKGPLGATEVKALPAPPQATGALDNQLKANLAKARADAAGKGMKVADVSTAGLEAGKALKKSLTDSQRQAISKSVSQQQQGLETAMAPVRALLQSKGKAGAAPSLAAAQELSNRLKGVQAALDAGVEKVLTPAQLAQYRASQPKAPELNVGNADVKVLGLKPLPGGQAPSAPSTSANAYYAYFYSYYTYAYQYYGYVYAYYGWIYNYYNYNYDYYAYVYAYNAYFYAYNAYVYNWYAYYYDPYSTYAYYGYYYAYSTYYYSYYAYAYSYYAYFYLYDTSGYYYYDAYLYNYWAYYYSWLSYYYSYYSYVG